VVSSQSLLWEVRVELSCDVALEAADGFGCGFAFGAAALEVMAGCGVVRQAGDHDPPEGAVGLTVAAAVESMPLLFAARGVEGAAPQSRATVRSLRIRLVLSPAATSSAPAVRDRPGVRLGRFFAFRRSSDCPDK